MDTNTATAPAPERKVQPRYVVMRNCCTSGNCTTCNQCAPFGTPVRVEHTETDDREYALEVATNWRSYEAKVKDRSAGRTEAKQATAFEQMENAIIDAGGRMLGSAGKLQGKTGLSVGYYVAPNGKPIILQTVRDGGVEVFTPISNDPTIAGTLFALQQYMLPVA